VNRKLEIQNILIQRASGNRRYAYFLLLETFENSGGISTTALQIGTHSIMAFFAWLLLQIAQSLLGLGVI
jgi:hypothetical protein